MLDAKRFGAKFCDRRNVTMPNRLMVFLDTDIGAWNRRWASGGQWCAGIIDPFGRFGMPLVPHADEKAYNRASRWTLCETDGNWDEMGRFGLACWAKPFEKFYLVRDAVGCS